jgi:hypothetical protein
VRVSHSPLSQRRTNVSGFTDWLNIASRAQWTTGLMPRVPRWVWGGGARCRGGGVGTPSEEMRLKS